MINEEKKLIIEVFNNNNLLKYDAFRKRYKDSIIEVSDNIIDYKYVLICSLPFLLWTGTEYKLAVKGISVSKNGNITKNSYRKDPFSNEIHYIQILYDRIGKMYEIILHSDKNRLSIYRKALSKFEEIYTREKK